jgi:hypothetical protein
MNPPPVQDSLRGPLLADRQRIRRERDIRRLRISTYRYLRHPCTVSCYPEPASLNRQLVRETGHEQDNLLGEGTF